MTIYDSHRRVPVWWDSLSNLAKAEVYKLVPFVTYNADGHKFTIVPQWFVEDFGGTPVDISSISKEHITTLGWALGV